MIQRGWYNSKFLVLLLLSFGLICLIYFGNIRGIVNFSNPKVENSQVQGVSAQIIDSSPSFSPVPSATASSTISPTKAAKLGNRVYFGLWTQGFFDPGSQTLHPEVLRAVEQKVGKKAAIAHYYRGWELLDSPTLLVELRAIESNGWRPMISVNPYFFSRCESKGLPLYKAIAEGNCDDFLHSAGKNLKQFGKAVFLRFAWEMNVSSMEWQIARTGSTNSDFISAWRRMHDIIYSESASNVLWVFCPDVANIEYAQIYPGDPYVDWVGLDGYNWGTTQKWSSWQNFSQVFSQAYNQITKVAKNKPLMLGEVNTTDKGGDKASWYKDMLAKQVLMNYPRIKAVVFYNEDRSEKENVNWLIDITPDSLRAFSESIKSQNYVSSF